MLFLCITAPIISLANVDRQNILFDRISAADGLSQAAAQTLLQDRHGFIWIGTQQGLNRYDGYQFEVFNHYADQDSSLANGYIYDLLEDNNGNLWVATDDGLDRFEPVTKSFIHYKHDPDSTNSLPDNTVRALLKDSQGTVWIGTSAGLARLDEEFNITRFPIALSQNQEPRPIVVRSLAEGEAGLLWIGTQRNGLIAYNPELGTTSHYRHDPNNDNTIGGNYIRAIFADTKGTVWIGSNGGGLSALNPATGKITHYRHNSNTDSLGSDLVWKIFEDRSGTLWIGTEGGGLNRWLPQSKSFRRYQYNSANAYSLADNFVYDIMQDEGDVIWVGTYSGISKWNSSVPTIPHFRQQEKQPYPLSSNKISAFAQRKDGKIWIATKGGGLDLWQPGSNVFINRKHESGNPQTLSSNLLMSLTVDSKNNLWIGSMNGGLSLLAEGEDIFQNFRNVAGDSDSISSNAVSNILEDKKGRLWVSTFGGGLNLYLGDGKFRRLPENIGSNYQFSSRFLIDLELSPEGKIWIASDGGGLMQFDPDTEQVNVFKHQLNQLDSISGDHIISLLQTASGLWVGTRDTGLNLYKNNRWQRFNQPGKLSSNGIYGILEDQYQRIWITHAKGLSAYDPRTGNFTDYSTTQGLQGEDFNSGAAFKTSSGYLLFGGTNGFNYFDPLTIHGNRHIPPIRLTRFRKFNEEVLLQQPAYSIENISLDYTDYVIGFEFAAMDYTNPEKNQYRYKLEGFDNDWVETRGINQTTYTNLEAGKYTFRVQGSNNDGVWNSTGLAVKLNVSPPLWATWWAYLLYFIGLALAFYVAARVYRERLHREEERRTNIRLKELVAERTSDLEKEILDHKAARKQLSMSLEEKEILLKEVHHRVKNNMQVISSLLNIQADTVSDITLVTLLNESQQRIKSMSLIHENLYRSDNLLEINFENYIEMLANGLLRFYRFDNLAIGLQLDVDDIYLDIDRAVPCGLIINELVSNSLKHAWKGRSGTGTISISFKKINNGSDYCFSIGDDGIGVPEGFDIESATSMGLEIVRILTQQLDGTVKLENDNGTTFIIEFPGNNHEK